MSDLVRNCDLLVHEATIGPVIEDILPKNRLDIKIKMVDEDTRQFIITPHGSKYEDLCERVL